MSLQVENMEKNMAKLTIEVSAEELEKAIQGAYLKQRNKISVPGFRKGKVPRQMIEKMYGVGIFYEDAANALIPTAYGKAYDECELDIVSQPKVEVVQLEKGKPFIFTAEVAVKPEVTLGEYKGLSVDKVSNRVTAKEIDAKLEEEQKYKKEFFVTYPLDDNMSIMDMLAEINTCTNKWDTKDRVKSITVKENCPKVLLDINKRTNKGYSLNAASLWLTFGTKVNTSVINVAMRGKYLDPLKNDAGIERGLKILNAAKSKLGEDLCKTRTTLSGWIVSKYEKTLDADKANFTDNMIQFINSIDSDNVTYLQKVKGKKGGSSKENLINKKLNELWDSFNVSVESAE